MQAAYFNASDDEESMAMSFAAAVKASADAAAAQTAALVANEEVAHTPKTERERLVVEYSQVAIPSPPPPPFHPLTSHLSLLTV